MMKQNSKNACAPGGWMPTVLVALCFFATPAQSVEIPVPDWTPSFAMPHSTIVERMSTYTDGEFDFAVFENGTAVIVQNGLTDAEVVQASLATLEAIFNFHPDMNPIEMKDGNVLVRFNHPAYNVVIRNVAQEHWEEIEARHLAGLPEGEVMITPLGLNTFDDIGKMALLGRAYFFLDAQNPIVVEIVRGAAQ